MPTTNTRLCSVLDGLGGLLGRPPLLVPLAGEPGTVALITSPDGRDAVRALDPRWRHTHWERRVSAVRLGWYRPGRSAARVRVPLLVVVSEREQVTPSGASVRVARRAPRGEVLSLPGGHYDAFLGGHERAVAAELAFPREHLLARRPRRPGVQPGIAGSEDGASRAAR